MATCGGDTLCLIDCDSGMVMKKYKVAGEVCPVSPARSSFHSRNISPLSPSAHQIIYVVDRAANDQKRQN